MVAGFGVLVLVVGGLIYGATHQASNAPTPTLTPLPTAKPIDSIQCLGNEQLVYHIHQHLELYDHGKSVAVPALIGIPNNGVEASCYFWIHVHPGNPTGIIHVESPIKKTFTLGNFFDIWKKTSSSTYPRNSTFPQHLQAAKQVTAFYNGKRWTRGYRSIPLTEHANIAVEIGTPVVQPKPFNDWSAVESNPIMPTATP
jgi:hypothetical protein